MPPPPCHAGSGCTVGDTPTVVLVAILRPYGYFAKPVVCAVALHETSATRILCVAKISQHALKTGDRPVCSVNYRAACRVMGTEGRAESRGRTTISSRPHLWCRHRARRKTDRTGRKAGIATSEKGGRQDHGQPPSRSRSGTGGKMCSVIWVEPARRGIGRPPDCLRARRVPF